MLQKWKAAAEQEAARDLEVRNNFDSFVAVDDEERDAKQDILLGALEGHEGNMIVFSERNGWDVVSIIGEHYCTNQEERTLYVEAMLQLIEEASVRRRGAGIAYELTRQGLKQAKKLREMGVVRRKPGMQ